jgi:hypothetical protein
MYLHVSEEGCVILLRLKAAMFVLLLIGSLSLGCIGSVAVVGPMIAHGANGEHANGRILAIGPGRDFVLKTARGVSLRFQCRAMCRASLGHLERHLREYASTDVYYIPGTNGSLIALDVD